MSAQFVPVLITYTTATPEASVTSDPGKFALDVTNSILYVKVTGGGNTGWIALAGGGGGGGVFFGTGDPNGVQMANGPAAYFDTNGGIWSHNTLAVSNTGWVQYQN